MRFALAAPLLAFVARRDLRRAITPQIVFAGAVGYGIVIVLQNAGIHATSVSHAALIVGAVPALVALIAAATASGSTGPRAWVGLRARARRAWGSWRAAAAAAPRGRGRARVRLGHARRLFVVLQPRLLRGQNPMAVTAVQMVAGALVASRTPRSRASRHAPATLTPVVALVALILAGTLLRSRCSPTGSRACPRSSRARS